MYYFSAARGNRHDPQSDTYRFNNVERRQAWLRLDFYRVEPKVYSG